uniref:GB1/RHD3-type G domain-containing protein n=1 Tax=Vombatus ursinus TaxID=29139 RepID=A0A4X2LWC4_VOMUR
MASAVPMEAPTCLVENRNGELMVNHQAMWILTSITKPVVVVAIVGPYHTGKSYLMNRLARKNTGKPKCSSIKNVCVTLKMGKCPVPGCCPLAACLLLAVSLTSC